MNNNDIALIIYSLLNVSSIFITYKYTSYMIKKTGSFFLYCLFGILINTGIPIIGLFVLLYYSWGINEFLLIGNTLIGIILLVICEIILIISLLIKRKSLLNSWQKDNDNEKTIVK
ncbi:MAG TPA: hypothetical protein GXX18_14925 [Bacillales bacterium]|nr:hypothetical protein [Bacillales bacterium]